MNGLKRTNYCGEFNSSFVGKEVVVCGWVAKQRDLGSLIFIDLRDRTGIVQLAFDDTTDKEIFDKAFSARSEFVLMAKGVVRERSSKNLEIPTGEVEIFVSDLRILGKSETPPFEIVEDCKTDELIRLKYRYLDLRRPDLQKNILMRHKITKITRDFFDENGFIELETPMLIKSTPEGARDFLVPSRLHNGDFYALPQSPQLYKQLSMVAGFDRYMQIARCFRDEDLRADRQPEFTQIDLEMSFVDMEDVLDIGERFMVRVFKEALGVDVTLPLPRLTYDEAMTRFGSDKPDTRYGEEIYDLSNIVKDCGFGVFESAISGGGSVRAITVKNAATTYTRKEIDKLTEMAKGIGAKGLAWVRWTDEALGSSFGKFISEDKMNEILKAGDVEQGDVVLIIGDTNTTHVLSILGALRQETAKRMGIIPEDKYNLLWITEFPFFEWDEELGTFVAMHHPFTAPMDECLEYLESDKAKVRAKCYDLVLNGVELASGSIRITDPELQSRIFDLLGLTKEEAQQKFGYLLDAFKFGPPPHGGMGLGLDRLVMQMLRCETLRDVIAYPKNKDAIEPMTMAPSSVDDEQLKELGIKLDIKKEEE
ncbi:MAG: aspartate--tRNA ligase [Oscillospiraceae bacterium]|nr:aspartate--tRNA ligase [Candidatus Limimonas coprohippi]